MAKSSAGRSALSRVVQVLDAFDSSTVFLTASQLCDRAGMPTSTGHRILQELVDSGMLERTPGRTYRLGVKLWEWSARSPGAAGLRAAALPDLQRVHRYVKQHVQLAVLTSLDVLYIERLSAPGAIVNYTAIGNRMQALLSASGQVLVAHAPADQQEEHLAQSIPAVTEHTVTGANALRGVLAEARHRDYGDTPGYLHPRARGLAVPIRGYQDDLLGALSVVVPNNGAAPTPIIRVLTAAAASISATYATMTRGMAGSVASMRA